MRSGLALAVVIALGASANAASVHHSRARRVIVAPGQRVIVAPRPPGQAVADPRQSFAVPGWTEEETRRWMDNATAYP
jgi:hypothetical protein